MYSKSGGSDACMPLIQHLGSKDRWISELYVSQPGLQSDFQDSQDCYIEKPCLINKTTTSNNNTLKKKECIILF